MKEQFAKHVIDLVNKASSRLQINDASLAEIVALGTLAKYSAFPISHGLSLAILRFVDAVSRKGDFRPKNIVEYIIASFALGVLATQVITRDRPSVQTTKLAFGAGILLGLFVILENLTFGKELIRYNITSRSQLAAGITLEVLEYAFYEVMKAINIIVNKNAPVLPTVHLTTDLKERVFADSVSLFAHGYGYLVGILLGLIWYAIYRLFVRKEPVKNLLKDKKFWIVLTLILGQSIAFTVVKNLITNATYRKKTLTSLSKKLLLNKTLAKRLANQWNKEALAKRLQKKAKVGKRLKGKLDKLVEELKKAADESTNLCMKIQYEAASETLQKALNTIPDFRERLGDELIFVFWSYDNKQTGLINAYSAFTEINEKAVPQIVTIIRCNKEELQDTTKYNYMKKVLIGVIAHEFGHAYFLHVIQHIVLSLTLIFAQVMLVFSINKIRLSAFTASLIYYTLSVFYGNYFRRMEYQADAFSAEIDAEASRLAMEHLNQLYGSQTNDLVEEMHGPTDKRLKHIQRYLERLSKMTSK